MRGNEPTPCLCTVRSSRMECLLFQMEWHAGNTLSQTVYTLLYVHHLAGMDPDLMHFPQNGQTQRVHEGLITMVLRPAVIGLLKCCDLSWREMSKGKVLEVRIPCSIVSCTPHSRPFRTTGKAKNVRFRCLRALRQSTLSICWTKLVYGLMPHYQQKMFPLSRIEYCYEKSVLLDLLLVLADWISKNLLELLKLSLPNQGHQLKSLIASARKILRRIRESPEVPQPSQDSQARAAFDPYITRRLHSFIPIRIVELPPQTKTWDAIETLIDGFEVLSDLSFSQSVFAWNVSEND